MTFMYLSHTRAVAPYESLHQDTKREEKTNWICYLKEKWKHMSKLPFKQLNSGRCIVVEEQSQIPWCPPGLSQWFDASLHQVYEERSQFSWSIEIAGQRHEWSGMCFKTWLHVGVDFVRQPSLYRMKLFNLTDNWKPNEYRRWWFYLELRAN